MPYPSSDSYRNALRHMGQDYSFAPRYLRARDPHAPQNASNDIKPPEQQGYYPTGSFWTNTTNGNLWALQKIAHNLANWILLSSGTSGPILKITGDDAVAVVPDGTGNINLNGLVVPANTHANRPVFTESPSANTEKIDIAVTQALAAGDINKVGLSSFNNTEFTVDATGFVSLVGGGAAIEKVNLQTGTTPIVPTAGAITFNGATVAAGTNPVRTDGTGVSTMALEVQISQAIAATDATKIGLSNFDSKFFTVDSNGFVSSTAIANSLGVQNLGVKLSAGVFTIVGANGQFLSTTNPGFVTLHSNTITGGFITYKLTFANLAASPNFHDNSSGTTTIAGNTFGWTNNVNFASDIPFFLYAVSKSDDTAVTFMISRFPFSEGSITGGKIAQTGLTTQASFFNFDSTITAANFAGTNCLCIGAIRMQKVATVANDWTVTALAANDGIGQFYPGGQFSWAAGTFGAAASSFFTANGGTAPIYTSNSIAYSLNPDKTFSASYILGNNTTPGAGAVTAQLVSPWIISAGGRFQPGFVDSSAMIVGTGNAGQTFFTFDFQSTATNGTLQLGTIGAGSVSVSASAGIQFS